MKGELFSRWFVLIPPGSIPRGLPRKEFRLGCSIPRSLLRGCSLVAFALVAGYAGYFAIGVPLIHFLRRMGWLSLPTLVFSGAAAGIAVLAGVGKLLGILLGSSGSFDLSYVLSYVSWGAGLGFAVALLFSLIAGIPFKAKGRSGPSI